MLRYYIRRVLKHRQIIFRWISVRQKLRIWPRSLLESEDRDAVAVRAELSTLIRSIFGCGRRGEKVEGRGAEGRELGKGRLWMSGEWRGWGKKVFQSWCDFGWESGVYMNGKRSGKQQTFQNSVKKMEGQLKIENSLCLLEDEMEEGRNVGCWSIQQNLLYAIFIDHNKMIMISKKKRKKCRIFDQMSHFIATRNSLQCRSHHQKLIEKLGEIKAIILAFKKYFGKQYYRQQYNLHTAKHPKKELPSTSSIKCEDNPALDYCPSPNSEESSPQHPTDLQLAPAAEAGAAEGVAAGAEHETGASACKAESGIQYYFPYNYYIGNSILQFPFAASYFALQPIVPN